VSIICVSVYLMIPSTVCTKGGEGPLGLIAASSSSLLGSFKVLFLSFIYNIRGIGILHKRVGIS
jgi:hypothetical protein